MAFDTPDANANELDLAVSDLGPLAWVLDELRKSLESATKAIRRFVRDADTARGSDLASIDTSALRIARQQVHASVGALDMVGLAGPAALLRAMEQAVQQFVQRPDRCNEEEASKVERGSFALIQFLEATVAGRPVSAVMLFPQYKAIQEFLGAERIHPADLWEIDARGHGAALSFQVQAIAQTPSLRSEMDKSVLQVVKSLDKASALALRDRFLGLHAGVGAPLSTLWAVTAGFFEAVGLGMLPADVFVKRMPSRVLSAYSQVSKGEQAPQELLLRDLLFFCAQAGEPTDNQSVVLRAVRQYFGLARYRSSDYTRGQFGHFDPAVLAQARKRVGSAKDLWSNLAGGDTTKLKATADQFSLVSDSLIKLHAQSEPLAHALSRAVQSATESGKPPTAELAMEVATSVLYLEAAFEDLDPNDSTLAERTQKLAHRLEKVRGGAANEPLEPWIEELYRKVSDKQTMGSVVGELRVSLNELERLLDQFFREPEQKQVLRTVPDQLAQMRGVLTVLGLGDAASAVMRMRGTVEEILINDLDPARAREAGTFDKLGNNLGALGFLIDMLGYQPSFAKKLFSYDAQTGELRPLMGRTGQASRTVQTASSTPLVVSVPSKVVPSSPMQGGGSAVVAATAASLAAVGTSAAEISAAAVSGAPSGSPASASTASDDDFGDDDDLRDIFLEEAREVVFNGNEALTALHADPSNLADQTTLRRAFHTLKGSSRMVGLNDFGEAAWSMEQVFNAWLSDHRPATAMLINLSREAMAYLGAWVEGIAQNNVAAFSTPLVRASADAFRLRDEHIALHAPKLAVSAAAPAVTPIAESASVTVSLAAATSETSAFVGAAGAVGLIALADVVPEQPAAPIASVDVIELIELAEPTGAASELDFDFDLEPEVASVAAVAVEAVEPLAAPAPVPAVALMDAPVPASISSVGDPFAGINLEDFSLDLDEPIEALVQPVSADPAVPVDAFAALAAADTADAADAIDLDLLFDEPPVAQAGEGVPLEFSSSEIAALEAFELPQEPSAVRDQDALDVALENIDFDLVVAEPAPVPVPVSEQVIDVSTAGITADISPVAIPSPDLDEAGLEEFWLGDDPAQTQSVSQAEPMPDSKADPRLDAGMYGLGVVGGSIAASVGVTALASANESTPASSAAKPPEFAATSLGLDAAAVDNKAFDSLGLEDFELGELSAAVAVPPISAPVTSAPVASATFTSARVGSATVASTSALVASLTDSDLSPVTESGVTPALVASPVSAPALAPAVEPDHSASLAEAGDDQIKVIGPLRIGIPLYNVYLNEADEWSRKLQDDLGVWHLDTAAPLPEAAVTWAHSLAGSSGTVGFIALSEVARALEHALERAGAVSAKQAHEGGWLFNDAAQDIRRLLHQFAAGFLKDPRTGLVDQLKAYAPTAEPEVSTRAALLAEKAEVADAAPMEAVLSNASPVAMDVTALGLVGGAAAFGAFQAATPELDVTAAESTAPVPDVQTGETEVASAMPGVVTDTPVAPVTPTATEETWSDWNGSGATPAAQAVGDEAAIAAIAERPAPQASAPAPSVSAPVSAAIVAASALAASAVATIAAVASNAASVAQPQTRLQAPELATQNIDDDIDVQDAVDVDLFPIFEEEAMELLPLLSGALRQWHARVDNQSARSEVLRALHTLKGSARLAGALRLGEMSHLMESQIERFNGPFASEIEPLFAEFDQMQTSFDVLRARDHKAYAQAAASAAALAAAAVIDAAPVSADAAQVSGGSIVPQPTRLAATASASSFGSGQTVRVRSQLLDRMLNQAGEVMITRSRLEAELAQLRGSLGDLTANLERMRQQLREIELQAETQMQSRQQLAKAADVSFDPLEFDRFTRFQEITRSMAESVNDVATVQRNIMRVIENTEDDLVAQARQTRDLQRDLLKTRMVEFEGISERLYRVVRQAGKDTGKQVKLDILGGSIELDRGVLDRMTPAFEHLLRNCVAHGIESNASRLAANKDASGNIVISLHQEGNEVAVEFADDGQGLNLGKIKAKAISQGLMDADAVIDEQQAASLIFMPGFSTADQVSELSGRGIGMDVVRAEVQALGGRVETRTRAGSGTTFKLILPLTTAVTQVVMLRAGKLSIGTPSNVVEVVRRATAKELKTAYETGTYEFAGEHVPFFWSGALLQSSQRSVEPPSRTTPVVVFRSAQQRVAVHVDEVLGNQEVVVKNLGQQLARLPGLAGMSVLASGAVVLIYNPVALASVYGDHARNMASNALLDPNAIEAKARADQAQAATALAAAAELARPVEVMDPSLTLHGFAVPKAVRPKADVPLVMVVDDSITVRRVTQRLLAREGYRVVLAADGLQALEKLQDEIPAVVLSDIEMPRMDGFDLARNIRMDNDFFNIPIIMITSRIAEKHKEHAAELGVNHYLGKPYAEDELLSLVRRYCFDEEPALA